jgi:hypothetical protein
VSAQCSSLCRCKRCHVRLHQAQHLHGSLLQRSWCGVHTSGSSLAGHELLRLLLLLLLWERHWQHRGQLARVAGLCGAALQPATGCRVLLHTHAAGDGTRRQRQARLHLQCPADSLAEGRGVG